VKKNLIITLGTDNYFCYLSDPFVPSIMEEVETEYCYDDLRSDDIVLDIGANVGLFSLKVAPKVKEIFAVEPLFMDELSKNIELNGISNIHILPYALGNNNIHISFCGKAAILEGKTLSDIMNICGGQISFLKCDCEGGEWCINPHELKGIRRVEMEVHSFEGENKSDFVDMLKSCGFQVNVDYRDEHTILLHGKKL